MRTGKEWRIRTARDLGNAISGIRRETGLSQAALATKAGMERTYLSRLESDHSTIAIDRALRALRRMGAEVTVTLPGSRKENRGRYGP